MSDDRPPIPRQRDEIAAEAKRVANSRAVHQNRIVDELIAVDALTRRLDDLMDAMKGAP